jgi:hypothetical protein
MKTLLPNTRWLSLTSENLGQDWMAKISEIDQKLEYLGMDLAEESIFLIFDSAPGSVKAGEGRCEVARPVIGPKKAVPTPLKLWDWTQGGVYRLKLQGKSWEMLLEEAYLEWENLQRQGFPVATSFMLLLKRRIDGALSLEVEVLFPI